MGVSRLEQVPVRLVWKKEERDFTPWLEKNIDVLSEKIGVELSNPEKEKRAGTFRSIDRSIERIVFRDCAFYRFFRCYIYRHNYSLIPLLDVNFQLDITFARERAIVVLNRAMILSFQFHSR